jgi:hypothetical protein
MELDKRMIRASASATNRIIEIDEFEEKQLRSLFSRERTEHLVEEAV